jgi:hypothetical protein
MKRETAGLWLATPMTKGGGFWIESAVESAAFDDDVVVAQVDGNRPRDAALLAAAPELLKALDELLVVAESDLQANPNPHPMRVAIVNDAKAALAKARGETVT